MFAKAGLNFYGTLLLFNHFDHLKMLYCKCIIIHSYGFFCVTFTFFSVIGAIPPILCIWNIHTSHLSAVSPTESVFIESCVINSFMSQISWMRVLSAGWWIGVKFGGEVWIEVMFGLGLSLSCLDWGPLMILDWAQDWIELLDCIELKFEVKFGLRCS